MQIKNIIHFLLKAYRHDNFARQEKARFFLYAYFLVISGLILAFAGTLLSNLHNPNLAYSPDYPVLVTLIAAIGINTLGIILLKRGRFNLAAHIIITTGLVLVWLVTFISKSYDISRIDNNVYIIALLAFMPVAFARRPLVMLWYALGNILMVLAFSYYSFSVLEQEISVIISYIVNTSIAIVGITVISMQIFRLNNKALTKAEQDIEERKGEQVQLQKFSRAIEQSPVITIITNPRGVIEYVNPRFEYVTGYKPEEVIGKTPKIVKSGLHTPEFYSHMWKTILSGNTWQGELHNKKKNGELYWEYGHISPLKDEQGNITHFIGVKEDITQEKNAELLIQDAKMKAEITATHMEAIIENTHDSMWAFGTAYNILYVNHIFRREFKEAFGIDLQPGTHLVESLPPSLQAHWKDRYDRVLANEHLAFEDFVETEMGTIYVEMFMYPIVQQGKVTGGSCFARNITGRKKAEMELIAAKEKAQESEERTQTLFYELQISEEETRAANEELRATSDALLLNNEELEREKRRAEESEARHKLLFDNMIQGVVYHDSSGAVAFANPAATSILGLDVSDLKGVTSVDQRWKAVDEHGNLLSASQYPDQQTIHTGLPVSDFKLRIHVPDSDTYKWLNVNTIPIFEADQKTLHQVIVTFEDISRRKEAEEQELQSRKLEKKIAVAEESLRFKQNFLANMSHEIRTPLTGILGMTEILDRTPLNTDQQEYLHTIKHSCNNLRQIINSVLDFSKIEAGKLALKPKTFAFHRLVKHAGLIFNSLNKKSLKFRTDISDHIPAYIYADNHRLVQILSNLMANAVKFTDEGEVVLLAHLNDMDPESGKLEIQMGIKDTGIGIPKEKFQYLFQPFSQIDHSDIRSMEGTGLGLSICKELAELHMGRIWAESNNGGGSTFWFTFMAEKADAENDILIPPSDAKQPENLRILLAEDKEVNQMVIRLLLQSLGHQVWVASNGRKVLEMFVPDRFDMILMDIQMPEMDGITATQELRKLYENLPPIVGLSANAFEGDREKYIAQGLDEYLTKPFVQNDFVSVVSKLL